MIPFPCIVLTGLDFEFATEEANRLLRDLEVAIPKMPDILKEKMPLVYGCGSHKRG
jgi:hypothetical protein